jgi:tRNA threonylcarbamoyladenosine biosynthesis protein TsaE
MQKDFSISTIEDLPNIAKSIIALFDGPQIICLNGQMGAGKTTLVKALIAELGANDAGSSPTFALINAYDSEKNGSIYHLDLYRLNYTSEALDIGIEDLIYGKQWCFIEWPDKILELMDKKTVFIDIDAHENGTRSIKIKQHE